MLFIKKRKSKHVRKLISTADRERDAGNPAAAASLYKAAIEVFGEDFGILMQLGNSLKDSGQFSEAKITYEAASKLRPEDADCQLQLGHLHKLMGKNNEALKYYQKSVELQSENNPAVQECDWLYNDIQRTQLEKRHMNLRNQASRDKMNIFFGTSRESHSFNLNLAAMRFYKKIIIYNGWRR